MIFQQDRIAVDRQRRGRRAPNCRLQRFILNGSERTF
jgi:hypothetical protein